MDLRSLLQLLFLLSGMLSIQGTVCSHITFSMRPPSLPYWKLHSSSFPHKSTSVFLFLLFFSTALVANRHSMYVLLISLWSFSSSLLYLQCLKSCLTISEHSINMCKIDLNLNFNCHVFCLFGASLPFPFVLCRILSQIPSSLQWFRRHSSSYFYSTNGYL